MAVVVVAALILVPLCLLAFDLQRRRIEPDVKPVGSRPRGRRRN
jgi:hypothetical protein